MLVRSEHINNKDIHIVQSHHHALLAWARIRRNSDLAPYLISLDHHTDTMPAFNHYRCGADRFDIPEDYADALHPLIEEIDWNSDSSIISAISKLRHDEHIHAAVLTNILQYSFSINLMNQTSSIEEDAYSTLISERFETMPFELALSAPNPPRPKPPFTYHAPENRMFEISSICSIGCSKMPHDEACSIERAHQVLESIYLEHELQHANQMARSIGITSIETVPYILDIDLDYFHSEAAVNPQRPETFYRLIQNAQAITIATEDRCVAELRNEGSEITAPYLLDRVIEHIQTATSQPNTP